MIYKTLMAIMFASVASIAAPDAKAADKFDAWLNVFGTSDLTVTKLTDRTGRRSHKPSGC